MVEDHSRSFGGPSDRDIEFSATNKGHLGSAKYNVAHVHLQVDGIAPLFLMVSGTQLLSIEFDLGPDESESNSLATRPFREAPEAQQVSPMVKS